MNTSLDLIIDQTMPASSQMMSQMHRQATSWREPGVWGALVCSAGGGKFPLSGEKVTIGRLPNSTVFKNDERVSSVHCTIHAPIRDVDSQESQWSTAIPRFSPSCVVDSSLNGTFVNDRKVPKGNRCKLYSGDEISIVLIKSKRRRQKDEENTSDSREFLCTFIFQDYLTPHKHAGSTNPTPKKPPRLASDDAIVPTDTIEWQWGNLIGRGAFSDVYMGIRVNSGELIAIKRLHKLKDGTSNGGGKTVVDTFAEGTAELDGDTGPQLMKRNSSANAKGWHVSPEHRDELSLLQSMSHKAIVRYYGFALDDQDHVCILLEYVAGGSLMSLISNFGSFLEPVTSIYSMQILQGLDYLHSSHVVHGDIKPANLLLNDRGRVKLSDFGTSRIIQRKESQGMSQPIPTVELSGTPLWMSPEMVKNQSATYASDVWAFGCVVLEMVTGKQPWSEKNFQNPVTAVFAIGSSTEGPSLALLDEIGGSDELKDFLQACFTLNPMERPNAKDLLGHPFIIGGKARQPESVVPPGRRTLVADQDAANSVVPTANNSAHAIPNAVTEAAEVEPALRDHVSFLRTNSAGKGIQGSSPPKPAKVLSEGLPQASSGLTAQFRGLGQ